MHYHEDWNRIPDLCKDCRAARRAKWHEKSCVDCGGTIKYYEDWNRIPDLCKPCVKSRKDKWHETRCECGNIIRYHQDWDNPPHRCKECNAWQTKPCASRGCSGTVRYRRYWERVPEYCASCKKGERRITARQRKDDGSVHEYSGRGYVNRRGVAVFSDDTGDGKHSHRVTNSDGTLQGQREEGYGQGWISEPINVKTRSTERGRENKKTGSFERVRQHSRHVIAYGDRLKVPRPHTDDWAEVNKSSGTTKEGHSGENAPRNQER